MRRPRAPGAYLPLPLWGRYALSLTVAVVLLIAMVVFVNGHNTDSSPSQNLLASPRANREAEALVAEDQAPHVTGLPARLAPAAALTKTLRADMALQISGGSLDGPIQGAACRPSGPRRGSRRAFSCVVVAGDVKYPFLGVVDVNAHRITYCKRDAPPVPSDSVPVSRRCRA